MRLSQFWLQHERACVRCEAEGKGWGEAESSVGRWLKEEIRAQLALNMQLQHECVSVQLLSRNTDPDPYPNLTSPITLI